jgi:hypothetical protein
MQIVSPQILANRTVPWANNMIKNLAVNSLDATMPFWAYTR